MLAGASRLVVGVLVATGLPDGAGQELGFLMPAWALLGSGNALVLTPTGRVLRRSAEARAVRRCSRRSSP